MGMPYCYHGLRWDDCVDCLNDDLDSYKETHGNLLKANKELILALESAPKPENLTDQNYFNFYYRIQEALKKSK